MTLHNDMGMPEFIHVFYLNQRYRKFEIMLFFLWLGLSYECFCVTILPDT
jgi:hypothetical protein